jgi:integrase
MRVATYLRVSTGLQTVENQRLEIERHVTAKGWTMFREHADEGASGATTRRPALDQLMADARRRRFDGVCVAKLDRFGRSLKDLVLTLEELQSLRHALQWNDGQPQFVETKTKQSKRVIALANRVASALQLHRKTQLEARLKAGDKWSDRGLVFCTRTGGPLQGLNVTRAFQRLLGKAGLPRWRFNDLRHTAASVLLYKKVHPRVVADLLGHSEIRVTMDLYSHVAPALQREAADQMDALLAAKQA